MTWKLTYIDTAKNIRYITYKAKNTAEAIRVGRAFCLKNKVTYCSVLPRG